MSSLCRVCLMGNVRMHPIESIQKVYESVTNTKLSTVRGPRTVCYLCHSLLHKYGKFMEQARYSENILKDLFNKGIEATYENITKTSHLIQINFSTTCIETVDLKDMKNSKQSHDDDALQITAKDNTMRCEAVMVFNEEINVKEEMNEGSDEETMDFQSHDNYIEIQPIKGRESIKQGVGLGVPCDTCGKMFKNKYFLGLHIRNRHHKSNESDDESNGDKTTESFCCTHCNREFSHKSFLRHMIVHSGEKTKNNKFNLMEEDLINDEREEFNVLKPNSKLQYLRCYDDFMKWHTEKGFDSFTEKVMMTFFNEFAINHKPTTLWKTYSILKFTLHLKHNVQMKHYKELRSFLKTQANGYKSKKSKVFTTAEAQLFLNKAPDEKYLVIKVVMILAISGSCTVSELLNITVQNIERQGELILVKLKGINRKYDRSFLVKKKYVETIEKYLRLRPPHLKTDRFFLNYQKGKCVRSFIGKNKMAGMPKQIAMYLNLPNAHMYSGRCFRTNSAVL